MKIDDILTLVKAVSESNLTELKVAFDREGEDGKPERVTFKASKAPVAEPGIQTIPVVQQEPAGRPVLVQSAAPVQETQAPESREAGEVITSPMVGTFYAAPGEGAEPFIQVGDTVKKGQVIGIIEAMKLMNEVESPYDGVVKKILVENKAVVGFGDELAVIAVDDK